MNTGFSILYMSIAILHWSMYIFLGVDCSDLDVHFLKLRVIALILVAFAWLLNPIYYL